MLLHETTRKRICRGVFVICCLVPTLLVVAAIGYYHRPWRNADAAQDLSGRMHVSASFDSYRQPRPGVAEYTKLALRDLRTGDAVLRADRVRVDRRSGTLAITVHEIELPESELPELAALVEAWLATGELPSLDLRVEQLTLLRRTSAISQEPSSSPANLRLTNLHGHNKHETNRDAPPARRFWLQADVPTGDATSPVRLVVERVVEGNMPTVRATLDTRSATLPGWVLGDILPGGKIFRRSTFAGVLRVETDNGQVRGTLRGEFDDFDLRHMLPDGSTHSLTGRAKLEWQHLAWQDDRVEVAQGILRASDGTASRTLLSAAVELLDCTAAENLGNDNLIAFDKLACRFRLHATGLTVWGERPMPNPDSAGRASGYLLSRQGQPLLLEPKFVELPMARLVRLVTMPAYGWLPGTREAERIARALPLPSVSRGEPTAREPATVSTASGALPTR